MNPDTIQLFKSRLLSMRDALRELNSIRDDGSNVVELDQTRTGRLSRMDAMQMQAMAKAGQQRATIELQQIEAALRRIDRDIFGDCVTCGEAIAEGRLEANPACPLCLDCASAQEQQ